MLLLIGPFGMNGLADASGNRNTLVKSAAGVILTNGVVRLDGSQTKFSTALPLDLSSYTNLTVEFWMKATVSAADGILIEQPRDYNSNPGALIAYTGGGANSGQVADDCR